MVQVNGSAVNFFQEVFQLFDENTLLKPGRLFDNILKEDESGVQSALDLLQEEEDLLIVPARFSDLLGDECPQLIVDLRRLGVNVLLQSCR